MKPIAILTLIILGLPSCQSDPESNRSTNVLEEDTDTVQQEVQKHVLKALSASQNALATQKDGQLVLSKKSGTTISEDSKNQTALSRSTSNTSWTGISEKSQYIVCDVSEDAQIRGRKGTIIKIPKLTLKDKNGNPVKGNVNFKLTEYYDASDLIKSRIGTCSNGKILTTGGSIDLTAYQHGEELNIDDNSPLEILFPIRSQVVNGMRAFIGIREDNDVNWVEDKSNWTPALSFDQTYIKYDLFTGIYSKNGDNLEVDFHKKCASQLKINEHKDMWIYVSYAVTPMGQTEELEIKTRNCPEAYKLKIQSYFETLKINTDKGLGNNPFWTRISHIIKPSFVKVDMDKVQYMVQSGKERVGFKPQTVEYRKQQEFVVEPTTRKKYYQIEMRNFGLLNCDTYWRDQRPKTDILVHTRDLENSTSMIIIPNRRGVIMSRPIGPNSKISGIPIGEKCILVTINMSDNSTHITKKNIVVRKEHIESLKLEEIEASELDDFFEDIDQQFASMGKEASSSGQIM